MRYCKYGHAKTPENTYSRTDKYGWTSRDCRICRRRNEEKRIRDRTNTKRTCIVRPERVRAEQELRAQRARELSRVMTQGLT